MRFLKELFTLAGMLFSSAKNISEVTLLEMKHFPFRGYKYMMWCGRAVYREEYKDRISFTEKDKRHETVHLRQAQDGGSWTLFYLRYLWQWLLGMFMPNNGAYYMSMYEIEAFAKEEDETYLQRRRKGAVKDFKITPRQKFWMNECNKRSYDYKIKVKEIFKNA